MPDIDLEDIEALIIAADGDSTTEIATEMFAALAAEVRSLRKRDVLLTAVVEAARAEVENKVLIPWAGGPRDQLRVALAALDAGGEG